MCCYLNVHFQGQRIEHPEFKICLPSRLLMAASLSLLRGSEDNYPPHFMVNCGSSIVFIIAPSKLNFSSLLELWAVLYNATNMVLLRRWSLSRSIMSNYPQGQPSSAYLLRGSPACNKHKGVYVLSLTRMAGRTNFSG